MFLPRITLALAVAATLFTGCSTPPTGIRSAGWQQVPLTGVSGLAPAGTQWVAIGDAKKAGEPRAILLERNAAGAILSRSLRWVGREPVDLEAISAVPGTGNRFVAVTSRGAWFALRLGRGTIEVTNSGNLPALAAIKELEGFSLAPMGDRLLAVWGNRGSDSEPGRLFWSEWKGRDTAVFGPVQSTAIRMPWPRQDVRHVSDLRLEADGRLLVSSASDPGDNGPFASAVWDAGRFEPSNAGFTWKPLATPLRLLRDGPPGHKIEAISVGPDGRLVVASDDEALGSAIRF